MTGPRKRAIAVVCVGLLAAAALGTSAAAAGPARQARVVDGLDGPRGLDIAGGKTVVAETNGAISQVIRRGPDKGTTERIGKVVKGFGSAVAIAPNGDVWAVTGEGDARLFLFREGHKRQEVADIGRYQKKQNKDPFNLADPPGQSNPFNLASMDDGSVLVADAANNSVVHVTRKGKITPVARVKPRTVPMPEGFDNPDLPPAGTPLPSEAVTTSVAVGPDGAIYIGELRGFPGTPETSQIWKVRPGATDAVCKPNKPNKGACTRFADGLTSIVALEMGRGGSLYAAELSKLSWLAAEFEVPGAEVGAIIRIGRDPQVRRELSPGKVILPGGVAVGGNGNVFVSGPVFGPGSVKKVG